MVLKTFTNKEDEILIDFVKFNSNWYDVSHVDYKNKTKKHSTFKKIGERLGKTADHCYRRWICLKDSYVRYKKCLPTGTVARRFALKRLDRLSFLNGQRSTQSNVSSLIEDESYDSMDLSEIGNDDSVPYDGVANSLSSTSSTSGAKCLTENDGPSGLDELQLFFASTCEAARKLSVQKQQEFRYKVSRLLYEMQCNDPKAIDTYSDSNEVIIEEDVIIKEEGVYEQTIEFM